MKPDKLQHYFVVIWSSDNGWRIEDDFVNIWNPTTGQWESPNNDATEAEQQQARAELATLLVRKGDGDDVRE